MTNLVAVNNKSHLNTKVDLSKVEQHGADLQLVPVVLSEFINLAVQYPIVLTKNGNTGQFVFSVMLGFEPCENLFWQQEQWQGPGLSALLPLAGLNRGSCFISRMSRTCFVM